MKILIGKAASGKTTKLIKMAAKEFAYIVTANRHSAQCLADYAKDMGLDIPYPLTYDEFLGARRYARGIRAFMIDDVDFLLQHMIFNRVKISAITLRADCKFKEVESEKQDKF